MQASNRKLFLLITALVETGTGLCLLFLPAVLLFVLLGFDPATADAIFVGRLAGAALLAIGIASWMARVDGRTHAQLGLLTGISYLRRGRFGASCIRGRNTKDDWCDALARGCTSRNSCDLVFELFATSTWVGAKLATKWAARLSALGSIALLSAEAAPACISAFPESRPKFRPPDISWRKNVRMAAAQRPGRQP